MMEELLEVAPHNSNFLYVAQNPWEWIHDRDPPRASVVGSPSSPLNRFMTLERTTFVPNATGEGVGGQTRKWTSGQGHGRTSQRSKRVRRHTAVDATSNIEIAIQPLFQRVSTF